MRNVMELINSYKGEVYDLCYRLLEENSNHKDIFKYTCENFTGETSEKIVLDTYFESDEINNLREVYGEIVNGFINSMIKRCDYGLVSPNEFYDKLWEIYCANFVTLKEKAYAFYFTIIDSKIPYTYIGKPLSMEQERYEELRKQNEDLLRKIDNIFMSPYSQKTEVASLVLQCIDNIDDFDVKVVGLVRAMDLHAMKKSVRTPNLEQIINQIEMKIKEAQKEECEE